MAVSDVTWVNFQATISTALAALDDTTSVDLNKARIAVARAKLIAIGLGDAVAAQGTSVDLVCGECDKVLAMILEIQVQRGMSLSGGRFIKLGLANEGHKKGWSDGVLHP